MGCWELSFVEQGELNRMAESLRQNRHSINKVGSRRARRAEGTSWEFPSPALPGAGSTGLPRNPSEHSQPSREHTFATGWLPCDNQTVERGVETVNRLVS